jgi:hypothetical protein
MLTIFQASFLKEWAATNTHLTLLPIRLDHHHQVQVARLAMAQIGVNLALINQSSPRK